MALPAVPRTPSNNDLSITVNRLTREFNRTDRKAPIVGTDTGSGAAYVIAPVPGIKLYEIGQEFEFQAAHFNTTTTPTLAVNGLAAGTITDLAGNAIPVGNIGLSSWVRVIVTATTPTFALVSSRPSLASISGVMGSDVALNNTASWFDGASVAQGVTGVFLVVAHATFSNASGNCNPSARIYDGTNVYDSARGSTWSAGALTSITLQSIVTNPAGNLRIQGNDPQLTTTVMKFNASGQSKDTSISVARIG